MGGFDYTNCEITMFELEKNIFRGHPNFRQL